MITLMTRLAVVTFNLINLCGNAKPAYVFLMCVSVVFSKKLYFASLETFRYKNDVLTNVFGL